MDNARTEHDIHQGLKGAGYRADRVIPDSVIAEGLAKLVVDIARDYFSSVRIVPASIALSGEGINPREPAHIVYAKYSKRHPAEVESRKTKKPYVLLCSIDTDDGITVRL